MEGIVWKIDKKKREVSAIFKITMTTKLDNETDFEEYRKWVKSQFEKRIADKIIELAVKEMEKVIREGTGMRAYFVTPHANKTIIVISPEKLAEILKKTD